MTIPIEVYKGRGELEPVDRCQLLPDWFLNIKTDDEQLISKFILELVHDGL